MGFFNGCTLLPRHSANRSRDHAFIVYWAPPDGSNQLRLAVKDNIDMKGVVTTAGSEYLSKNSPPAARDAKCLTIARQRNVQIVGKTNLSEFAVAPSGLNDYFGTPKNPFGGWRKLIPGGSSSGSANAVASGKADIAFGTHTVGAIRVPAACCGVVGLKPTFGLVSLDGVFPIDPEHLDTVGPMAKDIAGVVQGMDLLQNGFAARYEAVVAAKPSANNIRIGRLTLSGTDSRINKAVDEALARAGFQVVALDDAFKAKWAQAQNDGTTVAAAGAWISDRKYSSKLGISARTKSILLVGAVDYTTTYGRPRETGRLAAHSKRGLQEGRFHRASNASDAAAEDPAQPENRPFESAGRSVEPAKHRCVELGGKSCAGHHWLSRHRPATARHRPLEAQMLTLQNTVAVNFAGNPALAIPIPASWEHSRH